MTLIDFRIRPADHGGAGDPTAEIDEESQRYVSLYGGGIESERGLAELIADMERHEVVGIVQAEYEAGDPTFFNDTVAGMLRRHPDRLLAGIATADPSSPDALEVLKRAHAEHGLKGWVFQPAFVHVAADDERCYPLYDYCQREGHPVTIHTGTNFSRTGPIEFGRPTSVDRVACDFPDLVLVCNHGGWPWVMETVAVLWKHENVYADFGAIAPKYMADPRGGWGPIGHWMNTQISHKVLLGTDWPMLRYERLLAELPALGLREDAYRRYVHDNAAELLQRIWGVGAATAAGAPAS